MISIDFDLVVSSALNQVFYSPYSLKSVISSNI